MGGGRVDRLHPQEADSDLEICRQEVYGECLGIHSTRGGEEKEADWAEEKAGLHSKMALLGPTGHLETGLIPVGVKGPGFCTPTSTSRWLFGCLRKGA